MVSRRPPSWINDLTRSDSLRFAAEHTLDLIVIGGGITGAGVALDAASRGLSVALVESHDLASGTSHASSKLVHGGLRYLATGDVRVAWESAVERGRLMRWIAPHLIRPLGFLIPDFTRSSKRDFLLSWIGTLLANAMRLATGLPGRILPSPRRVSAPEAHALAPALPMASLRGGVLYWDGQLEDDVRLVLGVARTAAALGAHIMRDLSAVRVSDTEVEAIDTRTGTSIVLHARVVVNATGIWAAEIEPLLDILPSRGTHVLVRSERLGHPGASYTIAVPGHFGRFVFVLPAGGEHCYIGLTDVEDHLSDPRAALAPDEDIDFLLGIVNLSMSEPLSRADVIGSFAGLRPLVSHSASSADASRSHLLLDYPGRPITIAGGKLTTYRRMAEDAVDAAVRRLGSPDLGCRTRRLSIVGASPRQVSQTAPGSLVRRYGSEADDVFALGREHPDIAGALYPGCPVTGEELLFGVLAEGATSVDDLLQRRSRLGLVPADAEHAAVRAAQILERGRHLMAQQEDAPEPATPLPASPLPAPGRRALLIVNPASGHGRALALRDPVAEALRGQGYRVDIHLTVDLTDATAVAAAASRDLLVVSLGGDGMHGAVAAGVRHSGALMVPLAGGRGNDTVHRLGLSRDAVACVRAIPTLRARSVDLGVVNGVPFLGVANVGFDARAAELANSIRLNLGPLSYLYAGARSLLTWRSVPFQLRVDQHVRLFCGWFVAVGNVGQYGGGLHITPNALADDAMLDVVTLGRVGAVGAAAAFLAAFRGRHLGHPRVAELRGRQISIDSAVPLNVYADGELVGPLPARIEVVPAAVRILVPIFSPALSRPAGLS